MTAACTVGTTTAAGPMAGIPTSFARRLTRFGVTHHEKRILRDTDYGMSIGSAHSSGVHALFGDGSIQSISYDVDFTTLNFLAHRADGQVAGQYE